MNRMKIEPQWRFCFNYVGGDKDCDHEIDDDSEYDGSEYGGTYTCLKCGCVMTYDVSDIGD